MLDKVDRKRISLNVHRDLHKSMKIVAAEHYMSITAWLDMVIRERIKYEIDLGYLEGKYE